MLKGVLIPNVDSHNREVASQEITLVEGDFIKGIGKLDYLSDITNGYLKGCSTYDTADSTTQTGILAIGNWGSGIGIHTYIPGWTQYKAGTFYGVLDLTQAPVVSAVTPSYQTNPYVDPDTIIDRGILDSFAKVNGQWQDLIGTNIDDILAGGSKYIKTTGSFTSASSATSSSYASSSYSS